MAKIIAASQAHFTFSRVYSVRFAGVRGYIVTFRQTDPLFVLDLQDAKAPKVLGELKIPGDNGRQVGL